MVYVCPLVKVHLEAKLVFIIGNILIINDFTEIVLQIIPYIGLSHFSRENYLQFQQLLTAKV